MRLFVVLAVLGAILVAVGVGLLSVAAGLVVAGVESVAGAYAGAYLHVKAREVRR